TTSVAKTLLFKAGSTFDSNSLFQVQNAASTALFTVDSLGNSASAPTVPGVAAGANTGGTLLGTGTYFYKISAIVNGTETALSTETSIAGSTFAKLAVP